MPIFFYEIEDLLFLVRFGAHLGGGGGQIELGEI